MTTVVFKEEVTLQELFEYVYNNSVIYNTRRISDFFSTTEEDRVTGSPFLGYKDHKYPRKEWYSSYIFEELIRLDFRARTRILVYKNSDGQTFVFKERYEKHIQPYQIQELNNSTLGVIADYVSFQEFNDRVKMIQT